MCSGFLIGRVRDISFIPLDAQLCAPRLLLIALDSYVRFASGCVLVVCGRSSDQSFDNTITMSLMPGVWALAGRRLPMNWEARHHLVGSSVHPPRPGGGTDADRDTHSCQGQKTRSQTSKGLAVSALRARPSSFQKTRFHDVESIRTRVNPPTHPLFRVFRRTRVRDGVGVWQRASYS